MQAKMQEYADAGEDAGSGRVQEWVQVLVQVQAQSLREETEQIQQQSQLIWQNTETGGRE